MDRRWSDMSETEMERLIRELPGPEPAAELRARVLAHASRLSRRPLLPRPALALASFAVLVLLDCLVLTFQDRAAGQVSVPAVAVANAERSDDQKWLAELGLPEGGLLVARITPRPDAPDSYFSLRNRWLQNGEGG